MTDSHRQLMQASLCNEKNLIIIVSVSGETKDLIEAAEVAIKTGCKIITITNHIDVYKRQREYHTKANAQAMMETFRSYAYMDTFDRLNVVSSCLLYTSRCV